MKNIGLKIVALLLACVVWYFISAPRRERVRERIVTTPLSLAAMPSELVITTDMPGNVAVRVRGRKNVLRNLTSQNLDLTVDLAWVQSPGEVEITLRPQHLNVPADVEVVSIIPNKLRFRIEKVIQRTVPIRPFVIGQPPAGFLVGEPAAEPAVALVAGPSSQILKLSEVVTERIIMTGRTGTFVRNVAVVSDSPLVRVITPLTTQVTIPLLAEIGPSAPPAEQETDDVVEPSTEQETE